MVTKRIALILLIAAGCAPTLATRTPGPAISISASSWDFGTIKRGETATHKITVTSAGTDTLTLSLYSTCDCLIASADAGTIPPGDRITIELSYIGVDITDRVTKTLFVDSNDPDNTRLAFEATGKVIPGDLPHLSALPDPLSLSPSEASYSRSLLTLANKGRQDLKIEDIRCFGCISLWNHGTLGHGEELSIEIESLPDWTGARWIEIDSNDPVLPLKKVVIVEPR
jgi:hypothetical protein